MLVPLLFRSQSGGLQGDLIHELLVRMLNLVKFLLQLVQRISGLVQRVLHKSRILQLSLHLGHFLLGCHLFTLDFCLIVLDDAQLMLL